MLTPAIRANDRMLRTGDFQRTPFVKKISSYQLVYTNELFDCKAIPDDHNPPVLRE